MSLEARVVGAVAENAGTQLVIINAKQIHS